MNKCNLCPNSCNVNRNENLGFCGVTNAIKIAKYYLHPYEEPCISGTNGSGTIFFSGCSLKCVFCQNFELSRNKRGLEITAERLAEIFRELEEKGAHNINLVNPTHYSSEIIKSLKIYKPNIPIVYNTHGYEELSILENIDPYIDVYLPDLKYFSPEVSLKYSGKENYFEKASTAIKFMMNKPLLFDENGLIKSGTIIRHLVLPLNTIDSKNIIDWFAPFKDKAVINIMSQYTPFGDIKSFPELQRKITKREYNSVINHLIDCGIENAFYQEFESASTEYIPSWDY